MHEHKAGEIVGWRMTVAATGQRFFSSNENVEFWKLAGHTAEPLYLAHAPAKAGEREQVAEAEHELREALADNSLAHHVHAQKSAVRTVLSALAEARSEVERVKAESKMNYEDATQLTGRLEAAESERDTLAAQLVGAREALEQISGPQDANSSYVELFHRAQRLATQALSLSILRGDKGCSLGAIEAPACGSPADSQPSEGR